MPQISLPGGSTLQLEAVHPTSGAAVGGVTASAMSVYGYDLGTGDDTLADTIPLYTPLQVGTAG